MAVVVVVVMLVRVWAAEFLMKEAQLTNIDNMNSVAISRGNAAQGATKRTSHTQRNSETARNRLQLDDVSLLQRGAQEANKKQQQHQVTTSTATTTTIYIYIYMKSVAIFR